MVRLSFGLLTALDHRACLERLSNPVCAKMAEIAPWRSAVASHYGSAAFRKVLVEVNSAAGKTLRAAIRILTFCFARRLPARPNLLLRSNPCFDVEYCDNPWFHDVFLIS